MSQPYRIYGSEASPYSVKVRSYFRFKGLPHEWIVRTAERMAEFQALAKLPLIPLVVAPGGRVEQDSTPIIEWLEAEVGAAGPALMPEDPALRFLSYLLEEYADEWLNKPMFHYRWSAAADQDWASRWIASHINPAASAKDHFEMAKAIRARMVPRLAFVGSHEGTRATIEGSFQRLVVLLEAHFRRHLYLFGSRPTLADFGLFGQIYELSRDPTPGAILHSLAPNVLLWIDLMQAPRVAGDFATWAELAPTLEPVLRDEVGGVFLPWSDANAVALAAGKPRFTAMIAGVPFEQDVQKYHARSLAALRARLLPCASHEGLAAILEKTRCRDLLMKGS